MEILSNATKHTGVQTHRHIDSVMQTYTRKLTNVHTYTCAHTYAYINTLFYVFFRSNIKRLLLVYTASRQNVAEFKKDSLKILHI